MAIRDTDKASRQLASAVLIVVTTVLVAMMALVHWHDVRSMNGPESGHVYLSTEPVAQPQRGLIECNDENGITMENLTFKTKHPVDLDRLMITFCGDWSLL